MKQWTEEDLILLYYQELDEKQEQELRQALTGSSAESLALQSEYAAICANLDTCAEYVVPPPSSNLNHRIMEKIRHQEIETLSSTQPSLAHKVSDFFATSLSGSLIKQSRPAFALVLLGLVGVFYLGRFSVGEIDQTVVTNQVIDSSQSLRRAQQDGSRRVLLSQVSSHIESSERLLRLVSNGGEDLSADIELRQQMINDLVSFNRLYRRLAEQSNDVLLSSVLQQMETVLLEISNTRGGDAQWDKVRDRLQGSDLLFKLRVTDTKINRELI